MSDTNDKKEHLQFKLHKKGKPKMPSSNVTHTTWIKLAAICNCLIYY